MPYSQQQKRQFYAIKNTLTKKEKDLINFYELQWALRHKVPTIEEVATQLKLTQVTVNYYLLRRPVIKALKDRGINYLQHTQSELTATQVAAAITIMNFTDTRSTDDKLDQLGINPTQYYAWLNDPQFKNLVDNLSEQNLKNIRPTAITEFTKLINKGDWNAVKYYLDVTGAVTSNDAPQSEIQIRMIVEVIQKHVKDPQIMMAIAADIKAITQNRTLEVIEQPAIESYVVHEPSVQEAMTKLGIG